MSNLTARILVVDDDPTLRELLVDTLTSIGYEAIPASSAEEALIKLNEQSVNLVISDIKMREMSGIELLSRLRKERPNLPVLLITGVDSPEIIGRAAPDGFLPKPFRIQHIEELIERALRPRKKRTPDPGKRILVIDDDNLFREMLTDSLIHAGFEPTPVASGEEALLRIRNERFDVVVSDVRMPTMDGLTLARRVRETFPDIPIIIMTAFQSLSKVEQDSGPLPADRFIQKPFEVSALIELIDELSPVRVDESV